MFKVRCEDCTASEILSDQSSLLKSIVIEIENNRSWKTKIFKTVADLVCEKIYTNIKELGATLIIFSFFRF